MATPNIRCLDLSIGWGGERALIALRCEAAREYAATMKNPEQVALALHQHNLVPIDEAQAIAEEQFGQVHPDYDEDSGLMGAPQARIRYRVIALMFRAIMADERFENAQEARDFDLFCAGRGYPGILLRDDRPMPSGWDQFHRRTECERRDLLREFTKTR